MKILVCTDGSRSGLHAVKSGASLAARTAAEVTLLFAVAGDPWDVDQARVDATAILKNADVAFCLTEQHGKLIDAALAQMVEQEYDLVVIGYQARTFLERALWGSLAARIVHELPLSVMIVRGKCESISRVLIGISGGGFTAACVRWGGIIASAFDARVVLLHVSPSPPLMYGGFEEVVEDLTELLQTDTVEAKAIRRAVDFLTDLGVKTDVELVRGLAEREILRYAQDLDADLIVIGSAWAVQPVRRFFMRNITEQVVLQAQRPVLVVRPVVDTTSTASTRLADGTGTVSDGLERSLENGQWES